MGHLRSWGACRAAGAPLLAIALACAATATASAATFKIESADPRSGLVGQLQDGADILRFESRVQGEALRSVLTSITGERLAEYVEAGHARPQLLILGVPYEAVDLRSEVALASLAKRPEAALVRELARTLVEAVPGPELARERRGLEVPYQASQHHFESEGTPPPLRETSDYLQSVSGYVVKDLDRRLILRLNYAPPRPDEMREGPVDAPVRPFHDPSQVDDCFGRCGGGCGSWQDSVIGGVQVISETWHPPGTWGVCPVSGGWSREYTGNCEHKACGCQTHGCAAHDWCVRELCGGDAFNACSWTFCNVPNPNPTSWTSVWSGVSTVTCLWRSDTCWIHYGPCDHTFTSNACQDPCCEAAITREEQIACGGCNY